MSKEVKVLLTGIGGPTPRGIAKSLKKYAKYDTYYIIATDCNPYALGLYEKKYIDKAYIVPAVTNENYWEIILDIIKKEKIDVAIVQPEVEVEEWSRYLKNNTIPCKHLLPPYDLVVKLRNRQYMNDLLKDTDYIPKSLFLDRDNMKFKKIEKEIGYPCWMRSSRGSSGLGALKINNIEEAEAWLKINSKIEAFTVSEYLPGRNMACKCLYKNGELIRAASAERLRYLMAKVAPSGITGNISFGKLISEEKLLNIAIGAINNICDKINVKANGLLTVDFKEDKDSIPKITEINVRNIAINTVFAIANANIVEDMVQLSLGNENIFTQKGLYKYDKEYYIFRDVDSEPLVIASDEILKEYKIGE